MIFAIASEPALSFSKPWIPPCMVSREKLYISYACRVGAAYLRDSYSGKPSIFPLYIIMFKNRNRNRWVSHDDDNNNDLNHEDNPHLVYSFVFIKQENIISEHCYFVIDDTSALNAVLFTNILF